MRFKKLVSLTKKAKFVKLLQNDKRQFIGTAEAVYLSEKLPKLDEESIIALWEIAQKNIPEFTVIKDSISILYDDTYTEFPIEGVGLRFIFEGEEYIPVRTSIGLMFLKAQHLTPINLESEGIAFKERLDNHGNIYIAVKAGLILIALITPTNLIDNSDFIDRFEACNLEKAKMIDYLDHKWNP